MEPRDSCSVAPMVPLAEHVVLWMFVGLFGGFLAIATIVSLLIGPRKPNRAKSAVYECGQEALGRIHSSNIVGVTKYFAYAVVFFVLDAFAWVIITATVLTPFTLSTVVIVLLYIAIVVLGMSYFLPLLRELR